MSTDLNWLRRMLSHNVRMPMSVITGYGELLRQGLLSAEEQINVIDCICENIIYMNDVLKVVLEEEDTELHSLEAVDIAALARRTAEFVKEAAKKVPVSISITAQQPQMLIQAEPIPVMRVFYHLFENAFKYLHGGNMIKIQIYAVGTEQILIVFKDNGRGIPERDVKCIFQKGFRSENSRGKPGSGYGLYDVKQIVERYGGTVKVSSWENEGFSVYLIFPAYQEGRGEGST